MEAATHRLTQAPGGLIVQRLYGGGEIEMQAECYACAREHVLGSVETRGDVVGEVVAKGALIRRGLGASETDSVICQECGVVILPERCFRCYAIADDIGAGTACICGELDEAHEAGREQKVGGEWNQ